MQISDDSGIRIRSGSSELLIDSSEKARCIITHAHADHCAPALGFKHVMSEQTASLAEARNCRSINAECMEFGKKFNLGEFEASLHNSGHILGSASILARTGETSVAVTSDFKLQQSIFLEPAEVLNADILVVETTFGLPSFQFPAREAIYAEMGKWLKERIAQNDFVVLAGYSIGKAQELTAIVNEYAGAAPIVHESVYAANRVYEQHGVKLGNYIELNHNLNESGVLIMPPSLVNMHLLQALSHSLQKRVVAASATGWGARGCFRKNFALSDHADFPQLISYVEQSKPKLVLTTHGYASEFANFVSRRLGIAARPLADARQRSIIEYAH